MARFMRLIIWLFWLALVVFLFIVLCNFLIAYISQSYEDVLENKIPNIYRQRCILNEEYYLFRRWLLATFKPQLIKPFDCFLLTFDTDDKLDDEDQDANLGVIKKVQETLKEHKIEVRDAINKNAIEMDRVQEEMKLYRKLMINYKKQLNDTGNDILNKISAIISENNRRIPDVMATVYERN